MPSPLLQFLATPLPALGVSEENLVIGFGPPPPPTLEMLPPSQSPKQQGSLPSKLIEFADAAQTKLDKHLWYVTERNVVFLFFSNNVSLKEKNEMWKKLQTLKNGTDEACIGEGLVQMPEIEENTHLKDLIGRDSLAFFELLPPAYLFYVNYLKVLKLGLVQKITKLFKHM